MAAHDEQEAALCWARFLAAAAAARAGQHAPARALIARVRAASGDYAAQTARRELSAYIEWLDAKEGKAPRIRAGNGY